MMKKSRNTDNAHWSLTLHHTSRSEAYKYACPKCEAMPQARCVYISDSEDHLRRRLGKPTQRPHVERTYLVQKQIYLDRQAQLKAWLRQFGSILEES